MGRKGRPKGAGPGGIGAQQQMQQRRAPDAPTDGSVLFYLYTRSGQNKPWYPVSAMKGDAKAKGLLSAWLNAPFGKSVFKDRLDEGMARTIFESERRLAGMAVEQYAQLTATPDSNYRARAQPAQHQRAMMYSMPTSARRTATPIGTRS
jgi:hypothetical protein